ncbi:MAG: T9SS type A sorting domain-containing protein [Bacteroidota bacterium]
MALRYVLSLLAAVFAPLAAALSVAAQSFEWRSAAGPDRAIGGVQTYADGSILGVSNGLLYRSSDEGQSWQRIAAAGDDLGSVRVDGARLWGLRTGRIETAAWLGGEWEARSPAQPVSQFVQHGDSLYAIARADNQVLYRSFDAGRSWNTVRLERPMYYSWDGPLHVLPSGALLRAWRYNTVSPYVRSEDGGDTWATTTCGGESVLAHDGTVWFGRRPYVAELAFDFAGSLWRSDDDGKTCTLVRDEFDVFGLASAADGGLLVGSEDGLYAFSDGGTMLERVALEGLAVAPGLRTPAGTRFLYTVTKWFYCFDPPCSGINPAGTFRWKGGSQEPTLTGPRAVVPAVAVLGGKLYAGGQSLYALTDAAQSPDAAGQGWSYVGLNMPVAGFYRDTSGLAVLFGPEQNYLYTDSGFNGYAVVGQSGGIRPGFSVDEHYEWLPGPTAMLRTRKGTALATTSGTWYGIGGVFRANVVAGNYEWYGIDGMAHVEGLRVLYESLSDGVLFAGCNAPGEYAWLNECPGAFVSTDDGMTWTPLADGLPTIDDYTEVFSFTTDVTGTVLAATRDGVYALDGTAWTPQGLPGTWVPDLETHPTVGTLAATERGVFRWDAEAATWQPVGLGLEERAVYDILATDDLIEGETVLVAATDRGVYTSEALVSIEAEDGALPAKALTVAAYPNPFVEALTVEVALPEAAEVQTTLYDVLGRIVAEVPVQMLAAGAHRLPVATARVATGVYLVRVVVEGQPERVVTVTRVR